MGGKIKTPPAPPHKSSNQRETELQSVTYRKAVCLVSFFIGVHKLRSQPHQTHSHPVYNTDAKGGYRKCKSNTEQFQEVSWEKIWDNKCERYNAGSQTIWICASLTLNVLSSDFTTFQSCQPKNKHNEKFPWTRPQMTTRTNKPDKTWFFFLLILKRGGNLHNINIMYYIFPAH